VEQPVPYTTQSLAAGLSALGMRAGEVVLVHSSMKRLGFVVGGVQAVVQAVLDVLGPDGTVVVPTHTPDNTDPADWQHPPVPEAWWPAIRQQAPGFDRSRTPSRWMGVLAEAVRTWPGAVRSDHPQVSFAALGKHAAAIAEGHRLDDALGEQSPLGAVYRLHGKVLLLGADTTPTPRCTWRNGGSHRHRGASPARRSATPTEPPGGPPGLTCWPTRATSSGSARPSTPPGQSPSARSAPPPHA
jgi:aminoglycoside 3-N-acetyltransferase